jgi:hypothetical protein
VNQRQGKGCRLSGAGLGAAEEVATSEHLRHGLGLNRRGSVIAFVAEAAEQALGEAEVREAVGTFWWAGWNGRLLVWRALTAGAVAMVRPFVATLLTEAAFRATACRGSVGGTVGWGDVGISRSGHRNTFIGPSSCHTDCATGHRAG